MGSRSNLGRQEEGMTQVLETRRYDDYDPTPMTEECENNTSSKNCGIIGYGALLQLQLSQDRYTLVLVKETWQTHLSQCHKCRKVSE